MYARTHDATCPLYRICVYDGESRGYVSLVGLANAGTYIYEHKGSLACLRPLYVPPYSCRVSRKRRSALIANYSSCTTRTPGLFITAPGCLYHVPHFLYLSIYSLLPPFGNACPPNTNGIYFNPIMAATLKCARSNNLPTQFCEMFIITAETFNLAEYTCLFSNYIK